MQAAESQVIPGMLLIRPQMFGDDRGFSCVTADSRTFPEPGSWRQLMSRTAAGVIRGLHVRSGGGEEKLVRCSRGKIFDVVADLRPGSPSFGAWEPVVLDGAGQYSVYIPAGCAHGYQALTDPADVTYHITGSYDPDEDLAVAWNDPDLGITWPLPPSGMSSRDKNGMSLAEAAERLGSAHGQ